MARFARVVVAGAAHHVTQRGKGRQFLLASDCERRVYLDLLRQAVHRHGVSVVGYCLLSLNPVRARLVDDAAAWAWSSAAAHCGMADPESVLAMEMWKRRWSAATWRQYLQEGESESELRALRRSTYTGRPLGSAEFIARLEQVTHRRLSAQKGGRPRKTPAHQIPKALL
jgi:hypothetical protein